MWRMLMICILTKVAFTKFHPEQDTSAFGFQESSNGNDSEGSEKRSNEKEGQLRSSVYSEK